MSDFEAFDSEFGSLSQDVLKNIGELKNISSSGDKNESLPLIEYLEKLFSQLSDLIEQIKVNARSHGLNTKNILNEKVKQYEKFSKTFKSDFKKAREQFQIDLLLAESGNKEQRQPGTDKKYFTNNGRLCCQKCVNLNKASKIKTYIVCECGAEMQREAYRKRCDACCMRHGMCFNCKGSALRVVPTDGEIQFHAI